MSIVEILFQHLASYKPKEYSVYMKYPVPTLAPLLRSNLQGDLLALTMLRPDQEFSLTEISRRVGAKLTSVYSEVARLVESGLLVDRKVGTARLVKANTKNRLYAPTRALLEATYGPRVILESVLAGRENISKAFIFGSWAARHEGEPGHTPNDIDLLLVGTISRRDAYQLAARAEHDSGIPVNVERVTPKQWESLDDPFVRTLQSRPLIELNIKEHTR